MTARRSHDRRADDGADLNQSFFERAVHTGPGESVIVNMDFAEIEARTLAALSTEFYWRVIRATQGRRAFLLLAYGGNPRKLIRR